MKVRIRNRILAVHAIVLLVGVFLSALIYVHGRAVMGVTQLLVERDLPALKSLADLKSDVIELEPILYEYYLSVNRGRFLGRLALNQQRIEANLGVARGAFPQSRAVADIEQRYAEIKFLAQRLDETLSAERVDQDEARALIAAISRACTQIVQQLDGLVKAIQTRARCDVVRLERVLSENAIAALNVKARLLVSIPAQRSIPRSASMASSEIAKPLR